MPVIHITKTNVEKLLIPESGRVDYTDDKLTGFGVRVSHASKTFFTLRRVNGKQVRTKIDTFDKITVEQARKRAEGILADMGKGIDPNQVKREADQQAEEDRREAKRKGKSLQTILDEYLGKGRLKPRTIDTYQKLCRLYLSDWLERPAEEITRDMVKIRHMEIARGKRQRQALKKDLTTTAGKQKIRATPEPARREAAADNCMRTLRAVLNYAFEDDEGGTLYNNPVNILSSKKRKAWYQVERRRTLLKNSELPAWFRAVESLENPIMRDYLLLLLFTGLRRGEAASLKWRQVDFQEGCFTVVDTKNGDPHTLPLSNFLYSLLAERKEGLQTELAKATAALNDPMTAKEQRAAHGRVALAESRLASQYVFPGEGQTGYINEPRRAINSVFEATGIKFSCHDLRRTFATIAESLELSHYTVKALLNHRQQLGDVTGGYIILNVDRLREPMQRITDAIQERVRKQYGQVVNIQKISNFTDTKQ